MQGDLKSSPSAAAATSALGKSYKGTSARQHPRSNKAKRIALVMLPGARQPARVGMEHTALKLTDPSLLRMVAAGRQGELVGSVTPQRATRPIGTRIVLLRVATRPRGEPFCPQAR